MVLCDDLAEWDGDGEGRRLKRMGIYVCIYLIHFTVHQKLTHYKAIIFQLKKKIKWIQFSSVQSLSCVQLFATP